MANKTKPCAYSMGGAVQSLVLPGCTTLQNPTGYTNALTHRPQGDVVVCLSHWPLRNLNEILDMAPEKFEWNFRYVIFKRILVIAGRGISCEIILMWMSLDFTDDQSILVQVMAWCRQATSHYLSQCWPRSLSPYGVTRPQWVLKV